MSTACTPSPCPVYAVKSWSLDEQHQILAEEKKLDEDSILIPVLEDILGWNSTQIRALFESHGLMLHEWEKARTDSLTISNTANLARAAAGAEIGIA